MAKAEHKPERPSKPLDDRTTAVLLLTMADTTWRMFVPTGILVTLALMADTKFGTGPWLTLLSLPLGLSLSVLLIKRQLRNIP